MEAHHNLDGIVRRTVVRHDHLPRFRPSLRGERLELLSDSACRIECWNDDAELHSQPNALIAEPIFSGHLTA